MGQARTAPPPAHRWPRSPSRDRQSRSSRSASGTTRRQRGQPKTGELSEI